MAYVRKVEKGEGNRSEFNISLSSAWLILLCIAMLCVTLPLSYIHGGVNGLLAGLSVSVLLFIASLVAFIPFAGVLMFALWVVPAIHSFLTSANIIALCGGLVFTVAYYFSLACAILVNAVIDFMVFFLIIGAMR